MLGSLILAMWIVLRQFASVKYSGCLFYTEICKQSPNCNFNVESDLFYSQPPHFKIFSGLSGETLSVAWDDGENELKKLQAAWTAYVQNWRPTAFSIDKHHTDKQDGQAI